MLFRKPESWNEILDSVRVNKSIRIQGENYGAKVMYDTYYYEVLIKLDRCYEDTFTKIAEHNFNNNEYLIEIYEYEKEEIYSNLLLTEKQNRYLWEVLYNNCRVNRKKYDGETDDTKRIKLLENMENDYLMMRTLEEKRKPIFKDMD